LRKKVASASLNLTLIVSKEKQHQPEKKINPKKIAVRPPFFFKIFYSGSHVSFKLEQYDLFATL